MLNNSPDLQENDTLRHRETLLHSFLLAGFVVQYGIYFKKKKKVDKENIFICIDM